MKFREMAQLSKEEREKKYKELELELVKLNAQVATGTPPKNVGQLRRIKKDIARLMFLKGVDEKIDTTTKSKILPRAEPKPQPKAHSPSQSQSQSKDAVNKTSVKTDKKTTKKQTEKTK